MSEIIRVSDNNSSCIEGQGSGVVEILNQPAWEGHT